MRRLSLALLASVLAVPAVQAADLPAPPLATDNWSVSVFGGATWLEDVDIGPAEINYDTGFIVGGTIGYTPLDWLRAEGEIAYTSSSGDASVGGVDIGSGDTDALSLMANVWLGMNMLPVVGAPMNDFGSGLGFSPYFGGGLGLGFINPDDESDTVFAWQVGAGVRFTLASDIGLDIGYRYRNFNDVDAGPDTVDLSSSNFIAGLTFNF
jgi:opacity protein-like surface antigen